MRLATDDSPAKELSFTHILQMDFVKRPEKRGTVVECFTVSTVSLRSASSPPKMWVRIRINHRAFALGLPVKNELTTPPAQARGVLSGASTFPLSLFWREKAALVWLRSDFRADALRHGGYPCFGA